MVADADITIETIEALSHAQVNAYLVRADAEHPCEACGADQWIIDHDEDQIAFTFAPLARNNGGGVVLLPITCGNCFNMRFLNAARMTLAIIAWENENG